VSGTLQKTGYWSIGVVPSTGASIGLLDRTYVPSCAGQVASSEVVPERPDELQGLKLLDRCVRVGERAVGNAQGIKGTVKETPFGVPRT